MQISLISPLSVEECIARLESAKKKDDIPFSKGYTPPYGELIGNTFNLQVNIGRYFPFMRGEFIRIPEGTLITGLMELPQRVRRSNTVWLIFGLPAFACLVVIAVLGGIKYGFSRTPFVMILIGIGLPLFYFYARQVGNRQMELNKEELSDFLKTTLEAKNTPQYFA